MKSPTLLELASKYPSPAGRVVTVPLKLVPAYFQLHGIKPYEYKYVERIFDDIMIVRQRGADDPIQEPARPVR